MKVSSLIKLLAECNPDQEIVVHDLSADYEVVLLSIDDDEEEIIFNVKTYLKSKEDKDKVH